MPSKNKFIFFSLAVTGTGISGGDRIFIELAREWSSENRITIYTSFQGARLIKKQNLNSRNLKVIAIPNYFFRKIFLLDYLFRVLYGVFLGLSLDANRKFTIYSSSEFLMDVIPATLLKLRNRNIKWIATWYQTAPSIIKGFAESTRENRYQFKALLYWLAQLPTKPLISKFADKIIVNNLDEKKRFLLKQTIVLIGAVPLQSIKMFMKRNHDVSKIYDAVFQGRFHPQKGVVELIEIWKKVVKHKPDAKLAMIGDGDLMKKVKIKIKSLKLQNNIKLFGYLFDGDKKFEIFSQSRVVVHPAFYDSGGMAAAEAMAFGLPAIGFDLVSYQSYYPKGMIKVDQNNFEKFSSAILKLLDDKRLYKKYSNEAQKLIEKNYSWQARAREIYNQL